MIERDSSQADPGERELGQVFTPDDVAQQIAGMLDFESSGRARILDAGAGHGALSEAVAARSAELGPRPSFVLVELDPVLANGIVEDCRRWAAPSDATFTVISGDFILYSPPPDGLFSHIVMNPPYLRVAAGSAQQSLLRAAKIAAPNLYGAFLWHAVAMLQHDGEMVAIVPRSFFSGVQFRRLRHHLLDSLAIETIRGFERRDVLFARDGVLQEVVIVKFKKSPPAAHVVIEWSMADGSLSARRAAYEVVVESGVDRRIRLLGHDEEVVDRKSWRPLIDDSLSVRTGEVVDFRTPEVSSDAGIDCVPLIDSRYEPLLRSIRPRGGPRYLPRSHAAVHPPGTYVVVSRFSPIERRPRIRAAVVPEERTTVWGGIAFENHVNYISGRGKQQLTAELAEWLLSVLTHPDIEAQFRQVSGSTQVNLSDIATLLVPPELEAQRPGV